MNYEWDALVQNKNVVADLDPDYDGAKKLFY